MLAGFANPSLESADAFRVLMNALARPGRIYDLNGPDAPGIVHSTAATLLTLLDDTTRLYLAPSFDTPELRQWLAFHVRCPVVSSDQADFALGHFDDLLPLSQYAKGSDTYPDRGCTLLVEVDGLENSGATLSGPGIAETHQLNVPYSDQWHEARGPFPQGLDCYFLADQKIAGLPRSTKLEF